MNFDLDDPLGDLLSDNSSDSFFESSSKPKLSTDNKIKSTIANKQSNDNNNNNSSKIQDLFRIKTNADLTSTSTSSTLQQSTNTNKIIDDSQIIKKSTTTPLSIAKTQPLSRSTPKKQISFSDDKDADIDDDADIDILSDLGFDPKKPKSNTIITNKKSTNILDDLLGITEKNSSQQFGNRPKTSPSISTTTATTATTAQLSRQSTTEKSDQGSDLQFTIPSTSSPSSLSLQSSNATAVIVRPKTAQTPTLSGGGRRLRRNSATLNNITDSLGLFSNNEMKTTNSNQIQKITTPPERKRNNLKKKPIVDWLGLGGGDDDDDENDVVQIPVSSSVAPQIVAESKVISQPTITQQNVQVNDQFIETTTPITTSSIVQSTMPNDLLNVGAQQLATANMETVTMMESLKQQEIQLIMANQMKNQEVALIEMQRRQQQLLQKQEIQFNGLLQKQLQRQGILEENIKRQQERLNSHIQILLTQPVGLQQQQQQSYDDHPSIAVNENNFNQSTATIVMENDNDDNVDDGNKGGTNKINPMDNRRNVLIELHSNCKRLELEKLRLEDLLQSIKINHQNEIDLMEQSYRKQIGYLEEMLEKLQSRLTEENLGQEEFFRKKITALEQHKDSLLQEHEQKLEVIEKKHEEQIEKLKKYHINEIEDINNGHKTMIDNIRQSKLMEFALVQENTSYLETLKNAVIHLESSNVDLKTIQVDLQEKIDRIHRERDEQLMKREKRLDDDRLQLDKQKETTEQEKFHLLELVKTLELKLNAVTQSSTEEQWTIRQQRASIDAERKSFDREKEFFREQCTHEEQKLNELKIYQSTEYERRMKQLDDERIVILSEKAKLETRARLAKTNDYQLGKTEIDSAVKVAEDAARQADVERERLLDVQRQYECKKRELIDQESALRTKQNELEQALNGAHLKERESENAIKQAKSMESKLMTRMQLLQSNYRELNERESQLSQAKLEMSKERLELQSIRKKLFQSRCSLCKIGERSQELSDLLLNEVKEGKSKVIANNMAHTTITTTTGSYPTMDPFNMDKQMPMKQSEILQILDNIDGADLPSQFTTHPSKSISSSLNHHQYQHHQQQQQYSITNALDKFNIIDNIFDDSPELLLASSDNNKYNFNIDIDNLPIISNNINENIYINNNNLENKFYN